MTAWPPKLERQVCQLLKVFEVSQYNHAPDHSIPSKHPVLTRSDLQALKMPPGQYASKTSGSTGEPVTVQKTFSDFVWYKTTNIREILWRGWDVSKNMCVVRPGMQSFDQDNWGLPPSRFRDQGEMYFMGYESVDRIQAWLEAKNPHYFHCLPSIVAQLDLSRLPNLIAIKGTGESGGTSYSSEECGTIALACPTRSDRYHVMENQYVEANSDGEILITTLTNPHIKRYKHGDMVVMGECDCGRSLQTIAKIHGRVRNMYVARDGRRWWPLFGTRTYHEKYGIRRFQMVQTEPGCVSLKVQCDSLPQEKRKAIIEEVRQLLDPDVDVEVVAVEGFGSGKFEEFVGLAR
jgi:phenylacetate-CoA ligase